LSIVSNKFNFIHFVEVFDLKTQNENYNTSVHNVKMIKKSLSKIKINNNSNYFYLLGDKGYKTKETFK